MNNLDRQFSQILANELVQEKLLVAMIRQKLIHQGLTISEEQAIEIEQQVHEGNFGHINITLSDEQANTLADKNSPLHIEFTDEDANRVDTQLQSIISDVYLEYAEILSTEILQEWLTKIPNFITENVAEKRSFESALNSAWAIPLDTLEALIDISLELGANFNQEFRPEALKEDDYVFEALTRLHARACQIAGEAYVLLKSGFADGAMARWRYGSR